MYLDTLLTALYLPGVRRPIEPPRRRWRTVESVLRRGLDGPAASLEAAGLHEEAHILGFGPGLEKAASLVAAGRVLPCSADAYPAKWRVFGGAPPVLWKAGAMPSGRFIAIVGSRAPSARARRFALECAGEAARLGYAVVSGGAAGIDAAGLAGARAMGAATLCILPCGLDARPRPSGAALAASEPRAEFAPCLAMQRNALVYSLADATVVVGPRFKVGGSWHGAVSALRQRLGPVLVWDAGDLASRALIALGARPIASPGDLGPAIASPHLQNVLPAFS